MGIVGDTFGDRMKLYERQETDQKFMPGLPIVARIDGRSFSNFTRGMARPYDVQMSTAMIETTKYVVQQTGALIGYTQSDEISLVWHYPDFKSQLPWGGKKQKFVTDLAATATAKFGTLAHAYWPDKCRRNLPRFDARAWQLPNISEAANAILWRVQDAVKNSISMAASAHYSANQLHGKNGKDKMELLHAKGVNWNDYPAFFKRGTFVRCQAVERELTADELTRIPIQHRPTGPVMRTECVALDMPPFGTVSNRIAVIFENADPIVESVSLES